MLFLGMLSVIIGLLFLQWCGTKYLRPPISRPFIFRSSVFRITSLILQAMLIIGGFFLVFKSSTTIGVVLLGVIVLMYLWFRRAGSIKTVRKVMYKTYYKVKRSFPVTNIDLDELGKLEHEKRILLLTLVRRYRHFGTHYIETLPSIVDEYPDIHSLTNFVILFEFYEHQYPEAGIEQLREYAGGTFKIIKANNTNFDDYMGELWYKPLLIV